MDPASARVAGASQLPRPLEHPRCSLEQPGPCPAQDPLPRSSPACRLQTLGRDSALSLLPRLGCCFVPAPPRSLSSPRPERLEALPERAPLALTPDLQRLSELLAQPQQVELHSRCPAQSLGPLLPPMDPAATRQASHSRSVDPARANPALLTACRGCPASRARPAQPQIEM